MDTDADGRHRAPERPAHVVVDGPLGQRRGSAADGAAHLVIGAVETAAGRSVDLAGLGRDGHDLLAARLALLRAHHAHPVSLRDVDLDLAETTLHRWRERIATWAEHPSAPMPHDLLANAYRSLDDNLTVTVWWMY